MFKSRMLPALGALLLAGAASTAEEPTEAELIEMLGYLIAQGGGVHSLKLDEAGIAAMAGGLQQALNGAPPVSPDAARAEFGLAAARAKAVESGSEELPPIDAASLQTLGRVMAAQSGVEPLGFGEQQVAAIAKGFIAGAKSGERDPAIEARLPAFQAFINARMAAAQEVAMAERRAAEEAFFAKLADEPDVQRTESGLHYKVIEPGAEARPGMSDRVLVHYKGTLIDGTPFDSSYDRGSPAQFALNGVVPGFGEGLTKIGVGGKIVLYIPAKLGYGDSPRPGGVIQPGDTLIFECELIEVNPG